MSPWIIAGLAFLAGVVVGAVGLAGYLLVAMLRGA